MDVRHMDGRAFTYPYNNTIAYNHLHSWGIWGKQTSAFFAAMTRELIFDHNIVHDGPRAGINQVRADSKRDGMRACARLL